MNSYDCCNSNYLLCTFGSVTAEMNHTTLTRAEKPTVGGQVSIKRTLMLSVGCAVIRAKVTGHVLSGLL